MFFLMCHIWKKKLFFYVADSFQAIQMSFVKIYVKNRINLLMLRFVWSKRFNHVFCCCFFCYFAYKHVISYNLHKLILSIGSQIQIKLKWTACVSDVLVHQCGRGRTTIFNTKYHGVSHTVIIRTFGYPIFIYWLYFMNNLHNFHLVTIDIILIKYPI